ncbi:MAG: C69 family dipeptidase [Clostridia bacterium]|nr:C69 family dipeptidase [Clostridia bacterium]MDY5664770.1 C69 family dipeptidase [Blautia sp.]
MACTTILVGKKASYDGSTMIARNDDSGSGHFTPKKFVVNHPQEQPRHYKSVISHVEIELPDNPMRYTAMPNAVKGEGIWAASGVNEAQVGMTATETITSNPRVLGADPLVVYQPARDGKEEIPGGIGEEDIVYIVLPYIHSAREGVQRLGSLLEKYGTYEMNGIAFQDVNEIWWLETIGGHHWIARRVPDDTYVVMPNQLGLDQFDLEDAFGEQKEYMCSPDMREFIEKNHLDLSLDGKLNPRDAFGSHDDSDHVYNTPRAWYMLRCLNPRTRTWDGPDAEYTPYSDDLPWCMVPEKKVTIEDVKYVLSSHYQGTPYDPYAAYGDKSMRGAYRSIGINRNDFVSIIQMRPDHEKDSRAIEWVAYASNAFNVAVPFYSDVEETPEYLSNTTGTVSTENFYWSSRMIAAMADASYRSSIFHIERYQEYVMSKGHELINRYDALLEQEKDAKKRMELKIKANQEVADMLKKATLDTLDKVLFELSSQMKNAYSRSDA